MTSSGGITAAEWTAAAEAENFVRGVRVGVNHFGLVREYEAGVFGDATGFVYFMAIGHPYTTHVKVGFTCKNPYSRMVSLQTGCPFKIRMLGFVFGNQGMEAELHDVFREERCQGEWFEYSDYVARQIGHFLTAQS